MFVVDCESTVMILKMGDYVTNQVGVIVNGTSLSRNLPITLNSLHPCL